MADSSLPDREQPKAVAVLGAPPNLWTTSPYEVHPSARTRPYPEFLCRDLCRNPPILTRIGAPHSVSLAHR